MALLVLVVTGNWCVWGESRVKWWTVLRNAGRRSVTNSFNSLEPSPTTSWCCVGIVSHEFFFNRGINKSRCSGFRWTWNDLPGYQMCLRLLNPRDNRMSRVLNTWFMPQGSLPICAYKCEVRRNHYPSVKPWVSLISEPFPEGTNNVKGELFSSTDL